jgi:hypothetical protein
LDWTFAFRDAESVDQAGYYIVERMKLMATQAKVAPAYQAAV